MFSLLQSNWFFVQQINNNNKEKNSQKMEKDEYEHLTRLRQSTCKNAIEDDIQFLMYGHCRFVLETLNSVLVAFNLKYFFVYLSSFLN